MLPLRRPDDLSGREKAVQQRRGAYVTKIDRKTIQRGIGKLQELIRDMHRVASGVGPSEALEQ